MMKSFHVEGEGNPTCTNIFIIMQDVSVTHTHEAMEMCGILLCHMF